MIFLFYTIAAAITACFMLIQTNDDGWPQTKIGRALWCLAPLVWPVVVAAVALLVYFAVAYFVIVAPVRKAWRWIQRGA